MYNGKLKRNSADKLLFGCGIGALVAGIALFIVMTLANHDLREKEAVYEAFSTFERDVLAAVSVEMLGERQDERFAEAQETYEKLVTALSKEGFSNKAGRDYEGVIDALQQARKDSYYYGLLQERIINFTQSCDKEKEEIEGAMEKLLDEISGMKVFITLLFLAVIALLAYRLYIAYGVKFGIMTFYGLRANNFDVEKSQLYFYMELLKNTFARASLIDVNRMTEYITDEEGRIYSSSVCCYEYWGKERRCENCIALRAREMKGIRFKLENHADRLCVVMARYLEIDGNPYILELSNPLEDELLQQFEKKEAVLEPMLAAGRRLYLDEMTGVYSRKFFESQLSLLERVTAIAAVDIDNLFAFNHRYGRENGDEALRGVAAECMKYAGDSAAVVKWEDDSFVIVFTEKSDKDVKRILEAIRRGIEQMDVPRCGNCITVSIGVVMTTRCDLASVAEAEKMLVKAMRRENSVLAKWEEK